MAIDVNANMIQKGLETIANATKVAANVTDKKSDPKKDNRHQDGPRGGNTTNQPHNQTVEVKVGNENWPLPAPQIIEKKPETHIHKHFPDNRPLTSEECKLEELRIKLDNEFRENERKYKMMVDERAYKERKEQQEYERKEREERKKEMAKKRKVRYLVGGAIGVSLLGLAAYNWYTDNRNPATRGNSVQPKLPEVKTDTSIQGEGSVE